MSGGAAWAVNLAVTSALVGLIWLVQVVQYPGFASVGAAEFARFHAEHSARITLVVGPLMLAEVAAAGWLITESVDAEARLWAWVSAGLVAVAWLSTAFVQVPLHGALSSSDATTRGALIDRLVATNWARTVAWSLRALVLLGWRLRC